AVRGCGPVARTRVMDATQLKAVADLPDPVQHDPMALIAFGQAPFASEILSEREWHFDWRPAGHAHERRADRVPETTERIRARRLPAMAHPLREGRDETVIGGAAVLQRHGEDAELRVRELAAIGVGIVHAGVWIERDVEVQVTPSLVGAARVDVVGLDRHRAADLPLDADAGLPRVVDVIGTGRRVDLAA